MDKRINHISISKVNDEYGVVILNKLPDELLKYDINTGIIYKEDK